MVLSDDASEQQPALALLYPALACSIVLSEAAGAARPWAVLAALLGAVACALPRTRALGAAGLLALHALRVVETFPSTANHAYLQLFLLAVAALLAPLQLEDAKQLLVSARIAGAAALLWAGVQKVLWGMYFDGRLLALLIAKHERYQLLFGPFIADAELQRLTQLDIHQDGSGPFLVDSLAVVAASNAVWALELGLGVALLFATRLRARLAWLAAGLIVAIELGARETVFGLLMLCLLALFGPPRLAQRALATLIAAQLIAAAIAAEWLPGRSVFFLGDAL